ncbi:MAG: hypothetical protein GTN99_04025, partial [Candidatus Dadabacteria bacterium]|nr:hypothetical protein [Candidatus Dadabacteria bacterium]
NQSTIDRVCDVLLACKHEGIKNIDKIVQEESTKLGLEPEVCSKYLTKSIRYDLGREEIEGMKKFGEYLRDYDIDIKNSDHKKLFDNLSTLQING